VLHGVSKYNGPTNAQLFQKLLQSYLFRHNRLILGELVVSYLAKLYKYVKAVLVIEFIISRLFLKSQCLITLKYSDCPICNKMAKIILLL
jgi:hypothetical protein